MLISYLVIAGCYAYFSYGQEWRLVKSIPVRIVLGLLWPIMVVALLVLDIKRRMTNVDSQ